jgi:hypothetical protein
MADMVLSTDQFAVRMAETKDYSTGYRNIWAEADVPDRQSHEPHSVRSQARETGTNRWSVTVTHGPHEDKDESGSYYKHVGQYSHEGPVGQVRSKLRSDVKGEWRNIKQRRP